VNRYRTPGNWNISVLAKRAALAVAGFGLAAGLTGSMLGQSFARPDGSIPVPTDWSSKHVIFTGDYNRD